MVDYFVKLGLGGEEVRHSAEAKKGNQRKAPILAQRVTKLNEWRGLANKK